TIFAPINSGVLCQISMPHWLVGLFKRSIPRCSESASVWGFCVPSSTDTSRRPPKKSRCAPRQRKSAPSNKFRCTPLKNYRGCILQHSEGLLTSVTDRDGADLSVD